MKPGFHYMANAMTMTQKQSDYKVEQSSFTLIVLFWLEIVRCRGRNYRGYKITMQQTTVTYTSDLSEKLYVQGLEN